MKTLLWLVVPVLLSAQTAVVEGDAVSGTTGEPVASLRVGLYDAPKLFTITDAAGHFRLPGVAIGAQFVQASGVGWLDRPAPIHPESGQNGAGIKLRMLPEAVISGKVEDEDGWPVFQARVMAICYFVRNGWQQVASGQTNDLGEYRIAKLLPGRYWLMVRPSGRVEQWDLRYTTTYYPGPPAAPDSRALSLAIGQQVSGLNIRLRKEEGRQVRGRVIWPEGIPIPANALQMQSGDPGGPFVVNRSVSLAPDGAFVARHVPPGSYRLAVEVRNSPNPNTVPTQAAYRRIEVADADIDDLVLEVKPVTGQDVAGTLATDAGMKPDSFQVVLAHGGQLFTAQPSPNGYFVVHGVPPGPYLVVLRSPDGRSIGHLQVRYGDAPAIRGEIQLDVQPASPLRITVLPPGIPLHGSVKDADNRPIAGAPVAIWGGSDERYSFSSTVAGGGFTVEAPLPGEYHVYIVDDLVLSRLLEDSEYLKTHVDDYPPVTVVQGRNPPLELVYSGRQAALTVGR
jgi:hypothetical protein